MYHTKKLRRSRKLLLLLSTICLAAMFVAEETITGMAAFAMALISMTITSLVSKKIIDAEEEEIARNKRILTQMKYSGHVVQPNEVSTIPEEVIEIEVEYGEVR